MSGQLALMGPMQAAIVDRWLNSSPCLGAFCWALACRHYRWVPGKLVLMGLSLLFIVGNLLSAIAPAYGLLMSPRCSTASPATGGTRASITESATCRIAPHGAVRLPLLCGSSLGTETSRRPGSSRRGSGTQHGCGGTFDSI
jgi:hypothetical protein